MFAVLRPSFARLFISAAAGRAAVPAAADQSRPRDLAAIDLAGFRSSAQPWREIRDESRSIKIEPRPASYAPGEGRGIAANTLAYQRTNGGWPKKLLAQKVPLWRKPHPGSTPIP